jgi:hypothetical protein
MSDWERFNDQFRETEEERNERWAARRRKERAQQEAAMSPDPTKEGVFRDHNCWKCKDGAAPCVAGNPRQCEFLHARND